MAQLDFARIDAMLDDTAARDTYTVGNNTTAYAVSNLNDRTVTIMLHGNIVAQVSRDVWGETWATYTLAGFPTVTTRDRLNRLARYYSGGRIGWAQRKGCQYVTLPSGDYPIGSHDYVNVAPYGTVTLPYVNVSPAGTVMLP